VKAFAQEYTYLPMRKIFENDNIIVNFGFRFESGDKNHKRDYTQAVFDVVDKGEQPDIIISGETIRNPKDSPNEKLAKAIALQKACYILERRLSKDDYKEVMIKLLAKYKSLQKWVDYLSTPTENVKRKIRHDDGTFTEIVKTVNKKNWHRPRRLDITIR